MRTEVITHDGATLTVRSAYRRTPIIVAQYMQALRLAYPELVEFETEVYRIDLPRVDEPKAPGANASPEAVARYQAQQDAYLQAMEAYGRAVLPVRQRHQLGAAIEDQAIPFVSLLSRVSAAESWIVTLGPDGRFDNASVVKAFEARLDEESDDPDRPNVWMKIAAAKANVDAPLTSTDERPPQTLTEAERADPLSAAAA